MENGKTEKERRGLPLGRLNLVLAEVALVLSALLLVATFRTYGCYASIRGTAENYVKWQQSVYKMQLASDYLTEQARSFVVTGKREYLNSYFEEVNVTRRREAALAELRGTMGDSPAYGELEAVMELSEALSARELYAMRLAIQSLDYDVTEFPPEIQDVELEAHDLAASGSQQAERARDMMIGTVYVREKNGINRGIQECYARMSEHMTTVQAAASGALSGLLLSERLLIVSLIAIVLVVVVMTSFLIITPLLRCVSCIRLEQPIPESGSYELRFLARTYNQMFEASRRKKEKLAYDASHDKLTGLYNRAGYDFLLDDAELSDSALLLIDVDRFKQINDSCGHDVGDRVLANIARVLRDAFRSDDCVCRIGGDEFAVIMGRSGPQFADQIRDKIERVNDALLHPTNGLPPVSVSVGVAFGAGGRTTGSITKDADLALYRVKENGRCGCEFYGQ